MPSRRIVSLSVVVSWRACVSSLAALMLLTCATACGASRVATAKSSPSQSAWRADGPSPREPRAYRVITHVEHEQSARFALLRTTPEELPASIRRVLRAPTFGINWKLTRRIPVALPGSYWLAPGNGYLCVISMEGRKALGVGTTCAPTREALDHGIASITITRPGSSAPALGSLSA